jgi:uncharacterized protein (DUF2236 family)
VRVRHRPSSPPPGDVRRFAADASLVLAGGRAILLQIADPVVAAGVARHSDFARRPQQRLVHTLMYVYAVVLGTESDRAAAAAFVNRAHAPVAGADDADRQLWVAATLYESALRMHEQLRGPVSPELAQAVLRAYAPLGGALRVPADRWPASTAAFEAYWASTLEALVVTDEARGVVRDLLFPRLAPGWVRAAMPLLRIITVGLLPDAVRSAYGFAWGPRERRRFARTMTVVAGVVRTVPGPIRRLPVRLLLRALRRSRQPHDSSGA